MSDYRVIVEEHRQAALTGNPGERYDSPPHPHPDALTLVRLLLGTSQLPDPDGPWRQAIPGGTRTIRLQPHTNP